MIAGDSMTSDPSSGYRSCHASGSHGDGRRTIGCSGSGSEHIGQFVWRAPEGHRVLPYLVIWLPGGTY
ncbi:MAG: hypothetical protein AVDCRST_MAG70-283 [uncultured Thermomicrobiales bacterium]|uniref:Uncharacterized protein n=1 Tax=uncultured Thermomicrobiales bacterium TaxID=1645740 RepID=A0A6J4UAN8_9BACT|nr:MAG: hypothetical protein AVDCRST_MAG70-283 [uncultured Thermomicrobiales bacterium]